MSSYSEDVVQEITDLIVKDTFTIEEICKIVGISKQTYYRWLEEKSDFSDAIKKARKAQNKNITRIARNSMINQISGYNYKEIIEDIGVDEEGNEYLKNKRTVTKYMPPNPTLIIFSLKNTDPDNFKDKIETENKTEITLTEKLKGITTISFVDNSITENDI